MLHFRSTNKLEITYIKGYEKVVSETFRTYSGSTIYCSIHSKVMAITTREFIDHLRDDDEDLGDTSKLKPFKYDIN